MRALVCTSILLGLAVPAAAQPGTVAPVPPPREVTTHYYTQTLAVDALSIGLMLGGMHAEAADGRDTDASNALMSAGLLGGFFGAPIVHFAHGHVDRGVESMLMRGALASLGMVVGVETATCDDGEILCGFDRIGPGVLGGLVVASVLDALVLTEETHEEPAWAPQLAASTRGFSVGVAATF